MPSILVTGTNRGLGLEFVKQYRAEGWDVHATCREPSTAPELNSIDGVHVHQLNTANLQEVDQLANSINTALDVVIANAGVMGKRDGMGQLFGTLDYEDWQHVLAVNVFGAVHTLEAFTPHLERGEHKKMIAITSKMGSISDTSGGFTAYRTSKAALNMALNAAAPDMLTRGIAVGVLHPGWVRTDMGGPGGLIDATESVRGLRKVIDALEPSADAQFLTFSGESVPW